MTSQTTYRITGPAVAEALTRQTGDTWTGYPIELNPDRGFKLKRERDGLTLTAYGNGKNPWAVSLDLWVGPSTNSRNWGGDRLPYFTSRERAEAAGKPWGKVEGKGSAGGGINIGAAKTAEQAAKDIARRSLPMVDPAWAHVVASFDETARYNERAGALADELAELAGVKATHSERDSEHTISASAIGCGYGSIKVYGDSVRLDLGAVTPDQARVIVKALAILRGKS